MDQKDIEQYKNAMMKLYTKRAASNDEAPVKQEREIEKNAEPQISAGSAEESVEKEDISGADNEAPENIENDGEEENEQQEYDDKNYDDGEHDTAYFPYTGDVETETIERIYPEPDLSEFRHEPLPEVISEESLGNSTGYILVNVRAGREGLPIGGASVVVSAVYEGSRFFIAAGSTDISGTTIKLEAPAPDEAYSQIPDPKVRPYSLFDISVRANGYFNARSVDVPVFSGVTSIQNFNMIPVPLFMESDDEVLTYYNQEPDFG